MIVRILSYCMYFHSLYCLAKEKRKENNHPLHQKDSNTLNTLKHCRKWKIKLFLESGNGNREFSRRRIGEKSGRMEIDGYRQTDEKIGHSTSRAQETKCGVKKIRER